MNNALDLQLKRRQLEKTIEDAQSELQLDDLANRYAFATGIPREAFELRRNVPVEGAYIATGFLRDFPDDIQSAGTVGILRGKWSDYFNDAQLDSCEISMHELIASREKWKHVAANN